MSGFIVVNGTQSMGKLLREIQLRDYKSSLILNKFLSLSRFGDTSASGCRIKGNPVRIRNSARYCEAHYKRKTCLHHCPRQGWEGRFPGKSGNLPDR